MRVKLFLMIGAMLLSSAMAQANGVGNGGDAMRRLFEQARTASATLVENLQSCSFQSDVSQEAADWILTRQDVIRKDIKAAPYLWVVDSQPTCGFTQTDLKSPIYLSYPTCASTVGADLKSAIFVVLHETAHHLGVTDEHEADNFAYAIQNADLNKSCPKNRISDVFDSRICDGSSFTATDARRYLAAGQTSAYIGKYAAYARYRDCTTLSGCTDWMNSSVETEYTNVVRSRYAAAIPAPRVLLTTDSGDVGFKASISAQFPNSGVEPLSIDLMSSHDGVFSHAGKDVRYAVKGMKNNGSVADEYTGKFNGTCVWLGTSILKTEVSSGFYQEGQIVVYGTH
jgi:hypothetical protein